MDKVEEAKRKAREEHQARIDAAVAARLSQGGAGGNSGKKSKAGALDSDSHAAPAKRAAQDAAQEESPARNVRRRTSIGDANASSSKPSRKSAKQHQEAEAAVSDEVVADQAPPRSRRGRSASPSRVQANASSAAQSSSLGSVAQLIDDDEVMSVSEPAPVAAAGLRKRRGSTASVGSIGSAAGASAGNSKAKGKGAKAKAAAAQRADSSPDREVVYEDDEVSMSVRKPRAGARGTAAAAAAPAPAPMPVVARAPAVAVPAAHPVVHAASAGSRPWWDMPAAEGTGAGASNGAGATASSFGHSTSSAATGSVNAAGGHRFGGFQSGADVLSGRLLRDPEHASQQAPAARPAPAQAQSGLWVPAGANAAPFTAPGDVPAAGPLGPVGAGRLGAGAGASAFAEQGHGARVGVYTPPTRKAQGRLDADSTAEGPGAGQRRRAGSRGPAQPRHEEEEDEDEDEGVVQMVQPQRPVARAGQRSPQGSLDQTEDNIEDEADEADEDEDEGLTWAQRNGAWLSKLAGKTRRILYIPQGWVFVLSVVVCTGAVVWGLWLYWQSGHDSRMTHQFRTSMLNMLRSQAGEHECGGADSPWILESDLWESACSLAQYGDSDDPRHALCETAFKQLVANRGYSVEYNTDGEGRGVYSATANFSRPWVCQLGITASWILKTLWSLLAYVLSSVWAVVRAYPGQAIAALVVSVTTALIIRQRRQTRWESESAAQLHAIAEGMLLSGHWPEYPMDALRGEAIAQAFPQASPSVKLQLAGKPWALALQRLQADGRFETTTSGPTSVQVMRPLLPVVRPGPFASPGRPMAHEAHGASGVSFATSSLQPSAFAHVSPVAHPAPVNAGPGPVPRPIGVSTPGAKRGGLPLGGLPLAGLGLGMPGLANAGATRPILGSPLLGRAVAGAAGVIEWGVNRLTSPPAQVAPGAAGAQTGGQRLAAAGLPGGLQVGGPQQDAKALIKGLRW